MGVGELSTTGTRMTVTNNKRTEDVRNLATQFAPRPGDYELGSVQSRAAARAMLDTKREDEENRVIQIVFVSPDGTERLGPRLEITPVK